MNKVEMLVMWLRKPHWSSQNNIQIDVTDNWQFWQECDEHLNWIRCIICIIIQNSFIGLQVSQRRKIQPVEWNLSSLESQISTDSLDLVEFRCMRSKPIGLFKLVMDLTTLRLIECSQDAS